MTSNRQSSTMKPPEASIMEETVEVPVSLLQKMVDAGEAFCTLEEEIEEFLIASDPALLSHLLAARASHTGTGLDTQLD